MDLEESLKRVEKLIPELEKELENFIKENPKNENEIEIRLGYLMYPQLKDQFDKLISYYKKINPEAAEEYKKYYQELYD